jgi:hypothetical protein
VILAGHKIVGFGIVSFGLGVLGLWIERDFFERWLVTPGLWCASVCMLTGGLGPILLVFADSAELSGIPKMQGAICIGYAFFFAIY